MIIDAASLAGSNSLETDVCIVGCGPAGGTVALELADRGLEVVALEAGPDGMPPMPSDGETAEVTGVPYPVEASRLEHLGGSAPMWHVWNPGDGGPLVRLGPLRAEHFEERPWLPNTGWPFGRDHLEGWFARTADVLGIAEPDFGVPAALDAVARDLVDGFVPGTLRFGPRSAIVEVQRRRLEACPARVVVNAPLIRLCPGPGEASIATAVVRTPAGEEVHVAARAFVLAAGGIDNARALLLLAGPDDRGPGNRHGLVGRFFTEHPHRRTAVIRTRSSLLDPVEQTRHATTDGELWFFTDPDEARRRGTGSLGIGVNAAGPLIFARGRWLDRPAEGDGAFGELWRHSLRHDRSPSPADLVRAGVRDPVPAASHLARRAVAAVDACRLAKRRRSEERFYSLHVMAEHRSLPDNRVTLSPRKASDGLPLARLHFTLDDGTLADIRANHEAFVDSLRRRLDGELVSRSADYRSPAGFSWGYHHMGTTRMHPDPARGVVDADCRVHDLDNLYVAGSSVFPTSGVTNPTFTLVALALRLADHLAGLLLTGDEGGRRPEAAPGQPSDARSSPPT
ncbi:MAG: GMC family oxidoreductase [Acidimicrobiales bacterium]